MTHEEALSKARTLQAELEANGLTLRGWDDGSVHLETFDKDDWHGLGGRIGDVVEGDEDWRGRVFPGYRDAQEAERRRLWPHLYPEREADDA